METDTTREVETAVLSLRNRFYPVGQVKDTTYLKINALELEEFFRTTVHQQLQKARDDERARIMRLAKHNSFSAYFVHQGADYITIDALEKAINQSELNHPTN